MDKDSLEFIVANEKEWRQYMIKQFEDLSDKVDDIDKELSTFKIRVLTFASVFGGATGLSADYIKNLFIGG